jgi:hypothetical protein
MPLQVNEKEKHDQLIGNSSCPMEVSGWSFKHQRIGENDISSVAIHGQDVILIEDIGTPFQTLKPLQGDFCVVARLMQDGERWLEKHQQPGVGLNVGHSMWLEWKHGNLESALTADDFFECYVGQDTGMSPSAI